MENPAVRQVLLLLHPFCAFVYHSSASLSETHGGWQTVAKGSLSSAMPKRCLGVSLVCASTAARLRPLKGSRNNSFRLPGSSRAWVGNSEAAAVCLS